MSCFVLCKCDRYSVLGDNLVFTYFCCYKNISEYSLNMEAEELTERFIQGDKSRSTEGSGLGLSIARSLTEMQGGEFRISVDGDLFKAVLIFPIVQHEVCSTLSV